MNEDFAKQIARVSYRVSAELEELAEFLEVKCGPEDSRQYQKVIRLLRTMLDEQLLAKILSAFPELKQEADAKRARYGEWIA